VALPETAVTALATRTEGWAAGLQLAALSLRGQPDATGFTAAFTGSHRYVLDFLTEEVLEQHGEQARTFLLETSVAQRLSGPLCDAVTRRERSQALLEEEERAGLFLIPLDEVRGWWRYHHLFADLLRARVPELHRNAAVWYQEHAMANDAIGHAVAAGEMVWAAPATAAANSDRRRPAGARTHRGCSGPPRKIPPDGHFRVTPCPLRLRSVQSTKTAREEGADDRDQARSSAERHGRDEPAGLERARVSAGTGAARYEIRVEGVLDRRWTTWFEGLEVDNDGSQTVISGEIADQAALHGLLNKVGDLGLTLISVHRSGPD
jgi:hypothetical protein